MCCMYFDFTRLLFLKAGRQERIQPDCEGFYQINPIMSMVELCLVS